MKVFELCSLQAVSTGFGAVFTGIEPSEIVAVMDSLGIGQKSRRSVIRNVRYMGRVAAGYLNSLQKKK